MNILCGILSIIVLLGIAVLISENRRKIKIRTTATALALQLAFMLFVIKVPIGRKALSWTARAVTKVLSFGNEGLKFVFGGLTPNFTFAFSVLALICFTSSLISVLYYFRVIPVVVKYVGKGIAKVLGTTEVETFCAVGNAFLGATEAPLLTKPYLSKLTRSELFCVVTGGFASVAASIIGGYVLMGANMEYILVAMATVPFATILISKIVIPETEEKKGETIGVVTCNSNNFFDAVGAGAVDGMNLALNVGAVLIGFIGIVALLNYVLGWAGTSLPQIFSYIFTPLAWLFNIPTSEVHTFARILGTKVAINECVAYTELGSVMQTLSIRTQVIMTVILCNFANLSVIGITVAGFKSFAPDRAAEVSGFGFKAFLAGLITTLVTGALIGMCF